MDFTALTGSWNMTTTTTDFPSGIRPPAPGSNTTTLYGPGLMVTVGIPCILLGLGVLVFSSVAFIYFRILERSQSKWRPLQEDSGDSPEENRHDYLVKRRNSLVKRLKNYKRKSRDSGWDGCGGDGSSFVYPNSENPEGGHTGPMTVSAIEDETTTWKGVYSIQNETSATLDDVYRKERPVAYVRPERRMAGEDTDDTDDDLDRQAGKIAVASLIHAEVHSVGSQALFDVRSNHSEQWSMNNFLEDGGPHLSSRHIPNPSYQQSQNHSQRALRSAKSVDNVFFYAQSNHQQDVKRLSPLNQPQHPHRSTGTANQNLGRHAKSMDNLFYHEDFKRSAATKVEQPSTVRYQNRPYPNPPLPKALSVQDVHLLVQPASKRSQEHNWGTRTSMVQADSTQVAPHQKCKSLQNISNRDPVLQSVEISHRNQDYPKSREAERSPTDSPPYVPHWKSRSLQNLNSKVPSLQSVEISDRKQDYHWSSRGARSPRDSPPVAPQRKSRSLQNISYRGPALQSVEIWEALDPIPDGSEHTEFDPDVQVSRAARSRVQDHEPRPKPYPTYESAQEQYLLGRLKTPAHYPGRARPVEYTHPSGETGV